MTTFAINEELWMMYNNKPRPVKVKIVFVTISEEGTKITYKVSIMKGHEVVNPNELFKTKELLLNSFL